MIDKQFADLPKEFRYKIPETKDLYRIQPTAEFPRGTKGRQAVLEVFKMDKELEQAILTNPTSLNLAGVLRKKGMLSMKEDAIIQALNKQIPFEEVNKV
jgi:type II secretory ATPase GspE/PulE/Tfp pilus assembly ATPase PilB-like protein